MKHLLGIFLLIALLLSGCATQQPSKTMASVPEAEKGAVQMPKELGFDALKYVQSLSLEEKVGQLFLARCPQTGAAEAVSTYHLGGYILFSEDFKHRTPEEAARVIASYQSRAKIPLLIAVDEEGGTVNRVSCYSQYRQKKFPSPRSLYAQGGLEKILETEKEKCQLLGGLGINVNLAPVCDITTDRNAFMYSRSLGQSPEETGRFVAEVTRVMKEFGVGSALKHFPGYGNNTDTHVAIAIDNRTLEELEQRDLVPFRAGIDAGCGAIMVTHTFINCLDDQYPATLSRPVHDYLREQMQFDAVVITDALDMQAITDLYGDGEAAVLAVLAGNDLLCTTAYPVQYPAVLEAVQSGRIPMERIDEAAARVLQWKYDLGLIE